MSLQQRLETIRADLEKRIPVDALAIMHQATTDLIASGQEQRIAPIGSMLPAFTLPDQDGTDRTSTDYLTQGPLVITFYRGLWCPYCNADLAYLGSIEPQFSNFGAQLIAISPQVATYSQKIRQEHQLNFPILTDQGNAFAQQLGLRFRLPNDLLALYRDRFRIDLPSYHDEDSWTLPMPARFVIDHTGIIRYAEASADYTKRPDPDAILQTLSDITASS